MREVATAPTLVQVTRTVQADAMVDEQPILSADLQDAGEARQFGNAGLQARPGEVRWLVCYLSSGNSADVGLVLAEVPASRDLGSSCPAPIGSIGCTRSSTRAAYESSLIRCGLPSPAASPHA